MGKGTQTLTIHATPEQLIAIVQAVNKWTDIKRRFVAGKAMMHEVIEIERELMRLNDQLKG